VNELDKSVGEFLLTLDYHGIKSLGVIAGEPALRQIQKIAGSMGISVHPMGPKFEDVERFHFFR